MKNINDFRHGLRTPREKIAFTALHGQKFNPNPKFLGMAAAYFVCTANVYTQTTDKLMFKSVISTVR